jgi:hypothetical protein
VGDGRFPWPSRLPTLSSFPPPTPNYSMSHGRSRKKKCVGQDKKICSHCDTKVSFTVWSSHARNNWDDGAWVTVTHGRGAAASKAPHEHVWYSRLNDELSDPKLVIAVQNNSDNSDYSGSDSSSNEEDTEEDEDGVSSAGEM